MATTERELHEKVSRWLRHDQGCLVIKLSALGPYGTSGWPDLLIIDTLGNVCFRELKLPRKKLTALQAQRLEDLRERGCDVGVWHSLAEAQAEWKGERGAL